MRFLSFLASLALGITLAAGAAHAAVNIQVDLGSQTMRVTSGNGESYVWPVSTARAGYRTPRGTFGVQSLQRMHYSRKYHNSPMPHSIFFAGGYAIHGTYATGSLGRAASHGCVRVSPANAAALYAMVQAEGARITISGAAPRAVAYASDEPRRHRHHGRGAIAGAPPADARPMAYAPLSPSFDDWMRAPAGY